MTIIIGTITLEKVTRYMVSKHMNVAVKEVANAVEASHFIDEETYSFDRPVYDLTARVSATLKNRLETMWESQLAESYDDGINTDTVQVGRYNYEYQVGRSEHLVSISLLGSST